MPKILCQFGACRTCSVAFALPRRPSGTLPLYHPHFLQFCPSVSSHLRGLSRYLFVNPWHPHSPGSLLGFLSAGLASCGMHEGRGLTYLTTEPPIQEQCPTQSSSLREKGRRNYLAWVVKLIMMSLTKEKLFWGDGGDLCGCQVFADRK